MEFFIKCVTVFMIPFYISGQNLFDTPQVPERCQSRKYMFRQCCLFPPFFNREVSRECGALVKINFHNVANVTGFRRLVTTSCDHWRCILSKYELTLADDEDKLDDEKYFDHLDNWVELNPEYTNVMLRAKLECKHAFKPNMPIKVCGFFSFQACIRTFIDVNCPRVIQTEDCLEVQKFYEECREYYQ